MQSDDKAGFPVQEFKSGVIYISPGQIRTKPVVEKPTSSSSASEITSSNIPEMAAKKLLDIQPSELKFNFELKKDVTCLLQLTNTSDNTVVFKVSFHYTMAGKSIDCKIVYRSEVDIYMYFIRRHE
ncbi:PREDICTED: uncharacterized protein LOC105963373 [Erythranthe guttata]|uniref:uncharacterized protein LOC105963373 n=1 Tax=Erythranthe guttata TaxID=4155 RepID=UPI00064DBEAD|nr:PREDICTED: uncharacterized protein LOC105963373 [Erythranthe guttata]|eukprot:XP_012843219.1 PREDICTED: uncharacterized protein LOC105963373 [Erythranthe guttata]